MISEQHNKLFTHFWFVACPEKMNVKVRTKTHSLTLHACTHAHIHINWNKTLTSLCITHIQKYISPNECVTIFNFNESWCVFVFILVYFFCVKNLIIIWLREWTNKILLNKINLNLIIIYPSMELWELWVREWVTECVWVHLYVYVVW